MCQYDKSVQVAKTIKSSLASELTVELEEPEQVLAKLIFDMLLVVTVV
jgi:hypothetical protein